MWEKLLKANIIENILQLYYKDIPFDIFKDEKIIQFFKDNSFYFTLNLPNIFALTQKETFKIYFGPNKIFLNRVISQKRAKQLWNVVDDAFHIIKMIHAWFHACQAFLFFCIKNNDIFDSPKRTINLEGKQIECNEGGETIEKLLFGRTINNLNFLEILYILDERNYQKSYEEFRKGFLDISKISDENYIKVIEKYKEKKYLEEYINGINEYLELYLKNEIKPTDTFKICKSINYNSDSDNNNNIVFESNINSNHNYRKRNNIKFGLPIK